MPSSALEANAPQTPSYRFSCPQRPCERDRHPHGPRRISLRLGKRERIERGPRLRGFAQLALPRLLDVQLSNMTTFNSMDGTR